LLKYFLSLIIVLNLISNIGFKDEYEYKINHYLIVDKSNNLIWQSSESNKELTWSEAKKYCQNLKIGSISGFRVPSILELSTLDNNLIKPYLHKADYWANGSILGFGLGYNYKDSFISLDSKDDIDFVKCVKDTSSGSYKD
jgi:hypothetical protein